MRSWGREIKHTQCICMKLYNNNLLFTKRYRVIEKDTQGLSLATPQAFVPPPIYTYPTKTWKWSCFSPGIHSGLLGNRLWSVLDDVAGWPTRMQLTSSTWKPLSGTVVQALLRWLHYLQNLWGPGLVLLSVFAKFSFGNARTLHPFNFRFFKFLKHEVLTTKLPQGLLVWATLMSVFFQKMQLLQHIAYTTVTAFLKFECLSLRTFYFLFFLLCCGEVVNTYKNFPLSLQYIISSTFSERSSKPICWHVLPHTIERSHGIDFKCWQGRPVNLSSPQPVKFSPSRTEHTLPDIQIHGLLTIDIPRKKAFFPP